MHADFAPLQVVLPPTLSKFFTEHGYCTSMQQEERNHARLNVRSEGHISFDPHGPTCMHHLEARGTVLIKDLSKTGVCLLYHTQIFPGELFELLTHNRVISATVVRCRRIDNKCYEIGASIDSVATCGEND